MTARKNCFQTLLIVSLVFIIIGAYVFLEKGHNSQKGTAIQQLITDELETIRDSINSPSHFAEAEAELPLAEQLPTLTNVINYTECTAINELRNVDFTDPRLQSRLCQGSPVYTLVRGKFPLCQLNRNLPEALYRRVRKGARLAEVRRVTGSGFMQMFTFDRSDLISRNLLDDHAWEASQILQMMNLLKKFTSDSVTFLDVGSNLGAYSIQARAEGYPVVAVDANIRTLIRLQLTGKNLNLLDDKLKLFWCFISDEVALKRMSWSAGLDCNAGSASGGTNAWQKLSQTTIEDTIPVMTVRADELAAHIATKNVIMKMDIESGEHLFMKTGSKLFSQFNIMALQMEFWRKVGDPPQTSPYYEFVTDFMTARNYSLLTLVDYRLQNVTTFRDWDGIWIRNDFLGQVTPAKI